MQPAAAAMNRFKESLIQFANSNPNLFPQNPTTTDYPTLINQQFSEFFTDFHTPNHPPYAAMINSAIQELNEKGGSSEESISKYIEEEYVDLPWAHSSLLKHHLEKLCDLKEICMTRKKCYLLVGADSDPISATTPEKQLKTSEIGKKSSQSGKKQKNRQDLKLGKTSSGKGKKGKKQKSRLDSESAKISSKHHEMNKKKGKCKQITEVCRKEDQAIQVLDEVTDEQEKHDVCIDQEMEEGGVCTNATDPNQTEKILLINHSDFTGNEDQSVELSNDKEQIETCETKMRKNKKQKIMPTRSSKLSKKNKETQLLVLSEANMKLDKEITDAASEEQQQMIEAKTSDTQIQEENKDVEVCQKEDQAIQALDEVADEQEKHDACIDQELGEGGVCAIITEQNQTKNILLIKHSDVTGSEDQSVELSNDKEQIGTCGTKKRKNKKQKNMPIRSSKRSKKHEEAQLLVLSENLNLDKEITDAASQEQKEMIEVKSSDTQIREENKDVEMALEFHSDNSGCKYMSDQVSIGVQTSDTQIQEKSKDVEMALELHSDNSGRINSEQIQMEQSPTILELEESPNSNHMLQQEGKKWTRSLLKSVLKRDVVAGSELTGSPGNANMPKGKLDIVEHLSEEKQQVPSAVSTIMNSQRAKLRSSKKSTVMESLDMEMEPQQKSRSPSLEKPVVELVEPAQVQEAGNTQHDQQPDELKELKPKPKGRGRPPKKSRQSFKKVKVGNRSAKPKRNEDKVTRSSKSKNKKDQPKKISSKSSKKKIKPDR